MRKDLKEVHNDYGIQLYIRTSSPAVNDDGSKILKKPDLQSLRKNLKEAYKNYSLPYDSLAHPTAVSKDDTKLQFKSRP